MPASAGTGSNPSIGVRYCVYYGGEWGIPRVACARIRRHRFEPPIKDASCVYYGGEWGIRTPDTDFNRITI